MKVTISEKLAKAIQEKNISLRDLSEMTGVSRSAIQRYTSGNTEKIPIDRLERLAAALGMDPAYFMGWTPPAEPVHIAAIRIPVLGSIPAGIPLEAVEDIIDWEEIPADWTRGGQEFFSLKVHGDSMSPRYEDGDVLILRKQDTCESGQDCAVMVDGSDATFKRVRISPAGVTLQPLNPEYDPLVFSNREVQELPVRILGVVVELRRSVE